MDDFDTEEIFTNESIQNETIPNEPIQDETENEESILKQIDRKLTLKFMKEVKTSRTYIFGLDNYIKVKEDRNEFIKNLKKSLGTSVIEKEAESGQAYGFAGDHVKYIYEYIVKKNICPIHEIKK